MTASYYFYICWEPLYAILLILTTIIDYFCGIQISKKSNKNEKRNYLILSLFFNLGFLFCFKYFIFFIQTVDGLLPQIDFLNDVQVSDMLLPIGISYYTLRKISYIVDIYREHLYPEKNLGKFALYVSFFLEIAAGPIDRAKKLLPQFNQKIMFEYSRVTGGLKLFTWGLFKKVVIADRLSIFVNHVFHNPSEFNGFSFVIATFFYSIQIYSDFSGYSDMAIGIARILGFNLDENFKRPYFSKSIVEFWSRWHITLSKWLRDYIFLFFSYGVSRRIKSDYLFFIKTEYLSYSVGILTTMTICGLWHGAKWTYLLWGILHGVYLILSITTRKIRRKISKKIKGYKFQNLRNLLKMFFTFSIISFLWIFFRAESLPDAFYIISQIFKEFFDFWNHVSDIKMIKNGLMGSQFQWEFILAFLSIVFMFTIEWFKEYEKTKQLFSKNPIIIKWSFYILLILIIMNFGKFNEVPFIYVKF